MYNYNYKYKYKYIHSVARTCEYITCMYAYIIIRVTRNICIIKDIHIRANMDMHMNAKIHMYIQLHENNGCMNT